MFFSKKRGRNSTQRERKYRNFKENSSDLNFCQFKICFHVYLSTDLARFSFIIFPINKGYTFIRKEFFCKRQEIRFAYLPRDKIYTSLSGPMQHPTCKVTSFEQLAHPSGPIVSSLLSRGIGIVILDPPSIQDRLYPIFTPGLCPGNINGCSIEKA